MPIPSRRLYRNFLMVALLLLAWSGGARAQEAKDAGPKPADTGDAGPGDAATTPAEDQDISAAISGDQQATRDKEGPPSISNAIRENVTPTAARFIPDISFILDAAFGWFIGEDHIRQDGHALDENGFKLQGLEMAVSGAVDPYFRYDMAFSIADLDIEEAYITTLSLPLNLQVRAGRLLAQFGRQNPQHLHTWNYVDPPLSHTRFMSDEHYGGVGGEISDLLPLPWYVLVLGQLFDTKSETGFESSSFGTVDETKSKSLDGMEDFAYVARVENFFDLGADWSLDWGLSGSWGQSPYLPDGRVGLYGTDVYFKWRPISSGDDALAVAITLEYLIRKSEAPMGDVMDDGGYAQLDVQFVRQWMAGLRGDYGDIFDGATPDPKAMPNRQWRGSASGTYLPTHFSKIRLQYDVGQEEAHDLYHAIFLQLEVGIGEHMAHKF